MSTATAPTRISDQQRKQCFLLIETAALHAAEDALLELEHADAIDGDALQHLLGRTDALTARLKSSVKEALVKLTVKTVGCLRLISAGETLYIGPTNGLETIARAALVFGGSIARGFEEFGCDVASKPTNSQVVQVFEMIKDGTLKHVYQDMGRELDAMCLTQNQIIRFVETHRAWLRAEDRQTFFLFKVKKEIFVAAIVDDVTKIKSGLKARMYRLSDTHIWYAENRLRFVVPQPA